MRKFYSLVLIAAGLLIGTQGWAENEIKVSIADQEDVYFSDLADAFSHIGNGVEATITLEGEVEKMEGEKDSGSTLSVTNGKHITLDLNGHNAEFFFYNITIDDGWFIVTGKGTLKFTGKYVNEAQGENRGAEHLGYKNFYYFIQMYGTNDATADKYSYVKIDKDVTVDAFGYGIKILEMKNTKVGYGAKADIYGYFNTTWGCSINGSIEAIPGENLVPENAKVPEINLFPGATMIGGIYCAGYGNYSIDGATLISNDKDNTLYIKAGNVTIKDATIVCTNNYDAPKKNNNGSSGGGNAIVLDSHSDYAEKTIVSITGDTKVVSDKGYAIEEVVTDGDEKWADLTIKGGNFSGNGQGENKCIKVTEEYQNYIATNNSIKGGIYNDDITAFVGNSDIVITYEDTEEGPKWTIGNIPSDKLWVDNINNANSGDYVQMKSEDVTRTELNGSKDVEYLALLGEDIVVVGDGEVLTAKEIVLNEHAKIIVEPGGMVQVTSTQGIISTSNDNLEIHTQEGNPGVLLINPEVTFNTTPKGSVSFISKSYSTSATNYVVQRFGIPTVGGLDDIKAVLVSDHTTPVQTAFAKFNYATNDWPIMGYLNVSGQSDITPASFNEAFGYYQMINNVPEGGTAEIIMTGKLAGNKDKELNIRHNAWNGFANSYTGDLDIESVLNMLNMGSEEDVDVTVYTYKSTGENTYTWEAINFGSGLSEISKVEPMQAFLFRNGFGDTKKTLNYEDMIYNPALGISSNAPARRMSNPIQTKAVINVNSAEGRYDVVTLLEAEEFSSAMDRGYDAIKYMNEDINFFISKEDKMSILASDNINNTFIGFTCTKGGEYTLNFKDLQGENLTLIDLETGARIAMDENMTYTFEAQANENNEYRFQVVKSQSLTTDMQSVWATKHATGVYSITGQYMCEANRWHMLPEGVYLINGEKRIKH